jgi:DNA-binding IclR family transcriptional regulator
MQDLTNPANLRVPFEDLKFAALNIVSRHPDGIRQADVAKALGIPAKFDHNWITKHLLDGLVEQNVLRKDERKRFTAI